MERKKQIKSTNKEKALVIKWLLQHGPDSANPTPGIGWVEVASLMSAELGFPVSKYLAYHLAEDLDAGLIDHYRGIQRGREPYTGGDKFVELVSILYDYIEAHPAPNLVDRDILDRLLRLMGQSENANG